MKIKSVAHKQGTHSLIIKYYVLYITICAICFCFGETHIFFNLDDYAYLGKKEAQIHI